VANTLGYLKTANIIAVKSFIVQVKVILVCLMCTGKTCSLYYKNFTIVNYDRVRYAPVCRYPYDCKL